MERVNGLRKREETANPSVAVYRFGEDIEIPEDIRKDIERYTELRLASIDWSNKHGESIYKSNPEHIREMQLIAKRLEHFNRITFADTHTSILSKSKGHNNNRPDWRGADSHVFTYNTDKYVFKYAVYGHESSPELVEYLQKKYALVKKYLGEHIPQSVFFLGEYRRGFDKHNPQVSFQKTARAITIQRRIHGKTFMEMTAEERSRPKVLEALRVAHEKYIKLKKAVELANGELGKGGFGLDVGMNLGIISDVESLYSDDFISSKCVSPNIIYSEEEDKVYFIDFGYGHWSPDKEEVFQYIMTKS